MCMQDLIINRAVTWQRVGNLVDMGTGAIKIPGNPKRVALGVIDSSVSAVQVIRVGPGIDDVPINAQWDTINAVMMPYAVVTSASAPGALGGDLYVLGILADQVAWEAVQDPELATIVQAGYQDMQRAFAGG